MGKLLAIWARKEWGGEMSSLKKGNLVENKGLIEDISFGGRRQITIIEREIWISVMKNLKGNLPPETRRANLMIDGTPLAETKWQILRIGECRIQIMGETKPCSSMDQKLFGLKNALKPNWNGGVFGNVIEGGQILVGDKVFWEDAKAQDFEENCN